MEQYRRRKIVFLMINKFNKNGNQKKLRDLDGSFTCPLDGIYRTDGNKCGNFKIYCCRKDESSARGEKTMHNMEQQDNSEYYKELGEIIRNYDSVLLFGPTEAKTELLNILDKNHLFSKIKFEVVPTDKMSMNQEHDFLRAYFSKES